MNTARTLRWARTALATLALLAATGSASIARSQDNRPELPEGVVARVHDVDIMETELLERIARTYARSDRGTESLNELVDDICVAREAKRRKASVSQEEIDKYLKRWDETIRQQSGGEDSLESLYEASSSREEFIATAREFLLRQKMAREDLGSKPDEDLSEHYLKLWLSSLRRRMGVKYENLPEGIVAQVSGRDVTRLDLARRIRSKLPDEMVAAVGNELVIAAASKHDVSEAGLALTESDLDEAMAGLRRRFAEEPDVKGSGVTFDQFLRETRGYGEAELRDDPVFRARIALRRMLEETIADTDVRAHWEQHQSAYGERALVRQMFFQAAQGGGEFELPTFKEAFDDALGARIEVFEATGLHLPEAERPKTPVALVLTRIAKRHTRDEERRRLAGEPQAWTRLSVEGEEKLADAVFEGALGTLHGPIRSSVGYHLLVVEERRDAPEFEAIRDRIRDDLVQTRVNEYQIRYKADSESVIRAW